MRTSKSSLGLAFLLINAVAAEAGVDLHNLNVERKVSGRRIENLVSGIDRSANGLTELNLVASKDGRRSVNADGPEVDLVNKIAQIDVGALLNAGTQGPSQQQGAGQAQPQGQTPGLRPAGPSDINTSNVGGDLANQVAENITAPAAPGQVPGQPPSAAAPQAAPLAAASPPAGQGQGQGLRPGGPSDIDTSNIAGELANQLAPVPGVSGQTPASNNVAGDLANQIAGEGASSGQDQLQGQLQGQGQVAAAKSGGAGLAVIEIKSTIIQEANGQRIATAVIEPLGQGQQQGAAAVPTAAPAIAAPQEPASPAKAPPVEVPAAMPIPSETLIKSGIAEPAPNSEAKPTQLPNEGISANGTTPTAPGTITEVAEGGKPTAVAGEAQKPTEGNSTRAESNPMLTKSNSTILEGNSTSEQVSAPGSANAVAAPAPITVSAGGPPAPGVEAAAKSSSTAPPPVDSAKLTADALVASPTVTPAGNPVTVQAGSGGSSNGTTTSAAKANGAPAAAVTVVAGKGSGSNSTSTTSGVGAAAVTVVAGSGSGSGSNSTSTAGRAGAAVTVVAGSGSGNGTAKGSATSTKTGAAAAITVIAGGGNGSNNADAAAANGGCNCACMCPAGSFPMAAPQAQPFQLGSMNPGPSASTMQTSAITVVAGPAPPGANQAVTSSSSSTVSVNTATLTTAGLLQGTAAAPAGPGVTMVASGSASASSTGNQAAAPPRPVASEGGTSVPVESAVAGTTTSAALPDSTASLQQNQQLPFDISTVALQSRVTVNLGRRLVKPTEPARRWLW